MRMILLSTFILSLSIFVSCRNNSLESLPNKYSTNLKKFNDDKTKASVQEKPLVLDSAPKENDLFDECKDESNKVTKCTSEQIALIKEIESITDDLIKLSKKDDLDDSFIRYNGDEYDNAKNTIYIIGEYHTDLELIKNNYAFILKHAKPDDIVLFEGSEYDNDLHQAALTNFVTRIYSLKEYNASSLSSLPYNAIKMNKFIGEHVIPKLLPIVSAFNKIIAAKRSTLLINYWDLAQLAQKEVFECFGSRELLIMRNEAMINTINLFKDKSSVFVVAGNGHSPIGNYMEYKPYIGPNPKRISEIYENEDTRTVAMTRNIYESYKNDSIVYLLYKGSWYNENLYFPPSL